MRSVVWIAGASSGLGAALAATCPWGDAEVVDVSRSGGGPAGVHLAADLSTQASWDVVADDFDRRLAAGAGRALLIWSVGTTRPTGSVGDLDPDAYADAVVLNAAAPQVVAQRFLAACRRHEVPAATVALISGGVAHNVYPGWSTYAAGKAAIEQWVRTVGAEEDEVGRGATVVALHPGSLDTPMQERIRAADPDDFPRRDKFTDLRERGRLIDVGDAARAVWAFLADGPVTGTVTDLRGDRLPEQ